MHRSPALLVCTSVFFLLAACDGKDFKDYDGDGFAFDDGDCDDDDAAVHPGATEEVNGRDDDCDDIVDNGTPLSDDDGDAYAEIDGDCNDGDPSTYPGATEIADGDDQDCDGEVDEDTELSDDDSDGYTEEEGDCDDTNSRIAPGAAEVCGNAIDDDCSGAAEDRDLDGDAHYDDACDGDDCNDELSDINPEVEETQGDAIDNNCDGNVDEDLSAGIIPANEEPDADIIGDDKDFAFMSDCSTPTTYGIYTPYPTGSILPVTVAIVSKDDGTGAVSRSKIETELWEASRRFSDIGIELRVRAWIDLPSDSYYEMDDADFDALVDAEYLTAADTVLLIATDCLYTATTPCPTSRGDGYIAGWADHREATTDQPALAIASGGFDGTGSHVAHELGHYLGLPHTFHGTCFDGSKDECSDAVFTPELPDGSNCTTAGDRVCDTPADPGPSWFFSTGCDYNAGSCTASSTCTMADGRTYTPEIENVMSYYSFCQNSFTAEQLQQMLCVVSRYYGSLSVGLDADGDTYSDSVDCDDSNDAINPAAIEICDGFDNDCSGDADSDAIDRVYWYRDVDDDDYGDVAVSEYACDRPDGFVLDDTDCNDLNPDAYPDAEVECTTDDNNCDGVPDGSDDDGDDYLGCNDDCDDTNVAISPAAIDILDGVDNDCSGYIDDDPDYWPADCDIVYYSPSVYLICGAPNYDWATAASFCASYGYHLAVLNDSTEVAYVNSWAIVHGGSDRFWIGLNDIDSDGTFVWEADGSEPTYPLDVPGASVTAYSYWPWDVGEPHDDGDEDCVEMATESDMSDMAWNDVECGNDQNWICEAGDGR